MQQKITGFHQDDSDDWVAELACGHHQHVRHNPPWMNREWVTQQASRSAKIGYPLFCRKCQRREPVDFIASSVS